MKTMSNKQKYKIIFDIVVLLNEHLYIDAKLSYICLVHIIDQCRDEKLFDYFR